MSPQKESEGVAHIWWENGIIWFVLLLLLAATVWSSYIPLGPFNSPINLLIAAIKAALVLTFFMHLRTSSPLIRLAAGASMIWLVFLFGLVFSDYLSRPMSVPGAPLPTTLNSVPGVPGNRNPPVELREGFPAGKQ